MSILASILMLFLGGNLLSGPADPLSQDTGHAVFAHVDDFMARVSADTLHLPLSDTLRTSPDDTLDAAEEPEERMPVDTLDAAEEPEERMPADTLDRPGRMEPGEMPVTGTEETGRRYEPVEPFNMRFPVASEMVTSDSLSRWELWSDQGEWVTRQAGVISFQQGGLGRNDGFIISGYNSRHQQVYRDGIPLNERIFGSANRKRLPHYSRIAQVHDQTASTRYRTEINTVRYHVTRPFTLVNYEQTIYDYRSTEGFLTRNLTPSTNLSVAYWGKNEGRGYRNNVMGGRNAAATMYHYLSDRWMLEGGFHYSGIQLGEPEGYQPYNMALFSFNRFEAAPSEPQGRSSVRNSLFRVTAYHRRRADENATTRISLYHDLYRRLHYNSTDSSKVRTHTSGVAGRHHLVAGPFELQGDVISEWSVIDRDRFETMDRNGWLFSEAKGTLSLPLPNHSRLYSWIRSGWRTDGFTDFELGAGTHWRLIGGFSVYGSFALGDQMPRPGQLYRRGSPVAGNPELGNETLQRAVAGTRLVTGSWNLGIELHGMHIRNPILVGRDSAFVQAEPYITAGAAGWLAYDGNRLEASLSGTFLQYVSDGASLENQLLDRSGQRVWIRASAYYKNYIYNRAAFMKAGIYIQASPALYRSSQYYPALDYWDPNSWHPEPDITEAQPLPEFLRLDLDLTARVRSAIFLFRLENALDNWVQPGYFETAWHPMPPMRLRFGIRWVLRN
ncbi:MAG: hypothetical protein R6U28_08885 [Cyclonatronaceae bacterium]